MPALTSKVYELNFTLSDNR